MAEDIKDSKAPFNMAINTLERLGDLLREIDKTEQMYWISLGQRQSLKVSLVKQFFLQASPLLNHNPAVKTQLQTKIMNLKPPMKKIIDPATQKVWDNRVIYDDELDKTMNILLVDIQSCLQEGNYFMPPRKDMRKSIMEMG